MMKVIFSIKAMCRAIAVCYLMAVSSHSYAALIFQFVNASIPEVDFVEIEAPDHYLFFGPDRSGMVDAFDLLNASTYGRSDFTYALGFSDNVDDTCSGTAIVAQPKYNKSWGD